MDLKNGSVVTEFILLGFSVGWELQFVFLVTFSLIYGATVLGNVLIMVTVTFSSTLHSPMYFLLGNLSFLDMCLSTVTTPKMIRDLLTEHKVISMWGCMAQMFFMHCFGGAEATLLVAMAFDRYVAICKPLHYRTIMSHKLLKGFAMPSWTIGFIHTMSQMVLTVNLPFCGPHIIDNIFCDLPLVIKLACMDTYTLELFVIAGSALIYLFPPAACLLYCHPAHCATKIIWRALQGSVHVICPHHCGHSVLWAKYLYLCLAIQ